MAPAIRGVMFLRGKFRRPVVWRLAREPFTEADAAVPGWDREVEAGRERSSSMSDTAHSPAVARPAGSGRQIREQPRCGNDRVRAGEGSEDVSA